MITIENLWRWRSGVAKEDDPMQSVYAHSTCAKERLEGASMDLDPHLFDEDDEAD